jgi:hypothetical protein
MPLPAFTRHGKLGGQLIGQSEQQRSAELPHWRAAPCLAARSLSAPPPLKSPLTFGYVYV